MSLWLARGARDGIHEAISLEKGVATVGFNVVPDLTEIESRDELRSLLESVLTDATPGRISNFVGQLWAFRSGIQEGDLVILPLKTQSNIAIGRVIGPYQYRTDLGDTVRHTRPVEWLRTDIPRMAFNQDLLYSLGAFMTVCQIKRNNAEQRVQAVLKGGKDPGRGVFLGNEAQEPSDESESIEVPDIEQIARDQLSGHIQSNFSGHKLAELVDAVLQAEGYLTRVSPPGPDGGVDILAGSGTMGFGTPRLCVQVKSSSSPADVTILRQLQGTLQSFKADQGLLVSWGGFKSSVQQEARQSFFSVRLWDSGDLLRVILKNYDRFSDQLKAELPLKRIWALVLEE